MRPPIAPQRLQSCNFFFENSEQLTHGTFLNNSVELLKLQDHLGSGTQGRTLATVARRIEISGMVFNYGWNLVCPADQPEHPADQWIRGIYLVTERLDNFQQPVALPDWTINQAPVTTAPGATGEQADFPLRVHWRDQHLLAGMAGLVATPSTNANQVNTHPSRTVNLRLKRYIDDFTGLYFQFYNLFNAQDVEGTLDVNYWVWGTIYYRLRFG